MIRITKEQEHYKEELDWLTTYHHFSFARYYDPSNVNFGPLRVFNDDIIMPRKGFGFHQHQDMEIVTYVIDGTLEHKDNLGNVGIILPGEIQRVSAGTGIFHSEFNHSDEKPLRLLQIWIFSDTKDLRPSWEQRGYSKDRRKNTLLRVIGPRRDDKDDSLAISQDATFYVSSLEKGKEVGCNLKKERIGYLFVIGGAIHLNEKVLHTRDAARIEEEESLKIGALEDTDLILIDLPKQYRKNSVA